VLPTVRNECGVAGMRTARQGKVARLGPVELSSSSEVLHVTQVADHRRWVPITGLAARLPSHHAANHPPRQPVVAMAYPRSGTREGAERRSSRTTTSAGTLNSRWNRFSGTPSGIANGVPNSSPRVNQP
jgi:hypothetical protein